jgi:glycine cleavage system H protein
LYKHLADRNKAQEKLMNIPRDLRYTKTHEWARLDKGLVVVGITDFAQEQLSDLTYVELPDVDDEVSSQDEVAVVESVKAASDIYAPVDGTVVEVNEALNDTPETVNRDPYGGGWIFKLKPSRAADLQQLLNAEEYEELLPESPEE